MKSNEEIANICRKMEQCWNSDYSDIDMSKVNRAISEFHKLEPYEQGSAIAWICGTLSDYRKRLDKGEGKIGVTKAEKRKVLMEFVEMLVENHLG